MALIAAPAPVAKAVVVGPGQMWGFSGCRCRFRLSGQGLLLPLRLMARSTTFLASGALPGWLIPPIPRDFGACKGEGEHADELSTSVQISWGWFPSSWLLSPPLAMKREGNVHAPVRFYQAVWTEVPHGGTPPPFSPGTASSAIEPTGSSDRYPLHGTLATDRAQTVPKIPGLMGGARWAQGHRPWGFVLLHERLEQD